MKNVSGEDLGRLFQTFNLRFGKCLEPTMSCEKTAIRAHSIQNSNVIDLLEVNNHVVALRPDISDGQATVEFKLVGRNQASTFTGLCSHHDHTIFAPIDSRPLGLKNKQQLFLLAYRSITRELHATMEAAIKIQTAYQSRVQRGLDPKDEPSESGLFAVGQMILSHSTWQYRYENFDKSLLEGKFESIQHDIFELDQRPTIAVSALFSLDEVETKDDVVRVILNVLPIDDERTVVVFSYTGDDRRLARPSLERIFAASGQYQKYELSKLIISSAENFLICPSHFDLWPNQKREKIKECFTSTAMARTRITEHPDLMLF